jgi:orotate phosphoribosyltransferase
MVSTIYGVNPLPLFQLGNFVLHSGGESDWKINCDMLDDNDIRCLARLVHKLVSPFCTVTGIPRGGIRLAEELQQYVTVYGPHLLVDDVYTTGNSMETYKDKILGYSGSPPVIIGAVIFARGPCPFWVKSLFQTHPELWPTPHSG